MTGKQTNEQLSTRSSQSIAPQIDYIIEMLVELQKLSAKAGKKAELLTHLLSMARHEAMCLVQSADTKASNAVFLDGHSVSSDERMTHEHTLDWWREQLDMISDPDG